MTIEEYEKQLEECDKRFKPQADGTTYSEVMKTQMSIWSNSACKGYVMSAARDLLDDETLRTLLGRLEGEFDMKSVEEAENYYIG